MPRAYRGTRRARSCPSCRQPDSANRRSCKADRSGGPDRGEGPGRSGDLRSAGSSTSCSPQALASIGFGVVGDRLHASLIICPATRIAAPRGDESSPRIQRPDRRDTPSSRSPPPGWPIGISAATHPGALGSARCSRKRSRQIAQNHALEHSLIGDFRVLLEEVEQAAVVAVDLDRNFV